MGVVGGSLFSVASGRASMSMPSMVIVTYVTGSSAPVLLCGSLAVCFPAIPLVTLSSQILSGMFSGMVLVVYVAPLCRPVGW